jgi:fluoride exporter
VAGYLGREGKDVSPLAWVAFIAAGAIGAPARYLVGVAVSDRVRGATPLGTLLVNVSGSLALGLLTGVALYHGFPNTSRIVLGTGFCGAYTTFSTFTLETVRRAEEGLTREAIGNALLTVFGCAFAAALGLLIAAV